MYMQDDPIATTSGPLQGKLEAGIWQFLGVPYAQADRFQPPRPTTWQGVRHALKKGPRSPQSEPTTDKAYHLWLRDSSPENEDCLVLNIFTASLDSAEGRPVMVYFHGGGFLISSGDTPGVDGSELARRGMVVVTVNHRLNLFGFLDLSQLPGTRYAQSVNLGMQDLVAALQWIRDNISQFGGNPHNVTVWGQSGGGSKVATLMSMPSASGLFHKAIIQSASSMIRLATPEESRRNTQHFLDRLGISPSHPDALERLPVSDLLAAMPLAIADAAGVDDYRPSVDGKIIISQPFEAPALALSKHIPLITGWCENEQRLTFGARSKVYQMTRPETIAAIARGLDIDPDRAMRLLEVYRSGRPGDSPGDLYAQILGDQRYRRTVATAAQARADAHAAPTYLYLLKWKSPVEDGELRSPHTLCLAFVFANTHVSEGMVGTAPSAQKLQEQMAPAWCEFALRGNPNHPGIPSWTPYDSVQRATMVFDDTPRMVNDPMAKERIALDECPTFLPSLASARTTSK